MQSLKAGFNSVDDGSVINERSPTPEIAKVCSTDCLKTFRQKHARDIISHVPIFASEN